MEVKNLIVYLDDGYAGHEEKRKSTSDIFSYLEKVRFHGILKLKKVSHYQLLRQNMLH